MILIGLLRRYLNYLFELMEICEMNTKNVRIIWCKDCKEQCEHRDFLLSLDNKWGCIQKEVDYGEKGIHREIEKAVR